MENTNNENTNTNAQTQQNDLWKAAGFTDEQIAMMREDAAQKLEAKKAEEAKKAREKEFESNLEIVLNDPLLAGHKEEFSKFARESSLRNFGREGLMETMKLFNKQLEASKVKDQQGSGTNSPSVDNPGDSTSLGASSKHSKGIPVLESNPELVDYTKVDLEAVHPNVRREVERRRRVQERRGAVKRYGW